MLDDGFLWVTRRVIVAHEVLNPVLADSVDLIGEIPRHRLRFLLRRPHGIDAVLLVNRLRGELSDVAEEVLRPRPLHLRIVRRPRIVAVDRRLRAFLVWVGSLQPLLAVDLSVEAGLAALQSHTGVAHA